jgi:hypothetical protein
LIVQSKRMKQIFCILFLFNIVLSLNAQDKRIFEIGASSGFFLQNEYDRANSDVLLTNKNISGGLYFNLSHKLSHTLYFNGAYFKDISYKNTSLGHGFYAEMNYSLLKNKPYFIFNNLSLKYGGFCTFNANYKYLSYLTNNEMSFLINYPLLGPMLNVDFNMPFLSKKTTNHLIYNLQASMIGISSSDSYSGTEQSFYPVFNTINKHLYFNSNLSYNLKFKNVSYNLGYRWIFEYSQVRNNLYINGTHQIYCLITLQKIFEK